MFDLIAGKRGGKGPLMTKARSVNHQASITQAIDLDPVLIAGAGPSGIRLAQELSRSGRDVVLLNAERWRPYNRVQLTPLLAGDAQLGTVFKPEKFPGPGHVVRYDGVSLVDVDFDKRVGLTSTGRTFQYSDLVLALGSRAFVPNIPGNDLEGVFVFRNFDDVEALLARTVAARRVAVIGGGLLGLEAARGMASAGANVTIIEHEDRLMPRQLDRAGADVLAEKITELGLDVLTGTSVEAIQGESGRVERLALSGDSELACDTVIICTGVRVNLQLATALGLDRNRGIRVDDMMRTSAPHVYAIGECAEHEGLVYGLVGPCYDQAKTAAASILGRDQKYEGSTQVTKLKVLGADVFSAGDFESLSQLPGTRSYVFSDETKGVYRRLFVRRGRLVGALGVGSWSDANRLQLAVKRGENVYPWQLWRFRTKGLLWPERDEGVEAWARDAIVCNCTGVTKGALVDAVSQGAGSIEELRANTSANTVCGTCAMHLQTLLGADAKPVIARWWKWLLALSGLAGLAALVTLLLPRISLPQNFVAGDIRTMLWFDSQAKQWSGYSLLGVSAVAALISLRKRVPWLKRLGGYDWWRVAHLVLGLLAALGLVWHTGLRLGSNLNMLLMLSFLLTLVTGAVAGLITGGEHELRNRELVQRQNPRAIPLWLHIIGVWPLPILLIFHILAVYMY